MLLRFAASNHLSLRTRQELSLVASSLKDNVSSLIHSAAAGVAGVLPAVVIYGANASGKSNILKSLRFMRHSVLYSHSQGEPGGGVAREPFGLDPVAANEPCTFEIDFVVKDVRFHYGFTASNVEYESEWLYGFPNNRRQMLFEREKSKFTFGRNLKGKNRAIADLTRTNSLFVSAAAQNDHENLSQIRSFFRGIQSARSVYVQGSAVSRTLKGKIVDPRIISFLGKVGTGVVDFRWREREESDQIIAIQKEIFGVLNRNLGHEIEVDKVIAQIELAHHGVDGAEFFLNLEDESDGTRRLLVILTVVFRALDQGSLILLDEIDASLHTQVCEAILLLFASNDTNPHGAQLIATTHDTNFLSSAELRRDQIWFTEKDALGATHLYPLTDISVRREDNLERGYLQGRFGAVPFAGSISALIGRL